MTKTHFFNYRAHRLFSSPHLDEKIEKIQAMVRETDPAFSELLMKARANVALELLIKVIVNNGLMNFSDIEQRARLNFEFTRIMKNKSPYVLDYFLVWEGIANFYNSKNEFAGIGRGSAGASFLNYLLKITKINPRKDNLLFARFYSSDEILPEITFETGNRNAAINYLLEQYKGQCFRVACSRYKKVHSLIKWGSLTLNRELSYPKYYSLKQKIEAFKAERDPEDKWDERKLFEELLIGEPIISNFFKRKPELKKYVEAHVGTLDEYTLHPASVVLITNPETIKSSDFVTVKSMDQTITALKLSAAGEPGVMKLDILGVHAYENVNSSGIGPAEFYDIPPNDLRVFNALCNSPEPAIVALPFNKHWQNYITFWPNNDLILKSVDTSRPKGPGLFHQVNSIQEMAMVIVASRDNVREDYEEMCIPEELGPVVSQVLNETHGGIMYFEQAIEILSAQFGLGPEKCHLIVKQLAKRQPLDKEVIDEALAKGGDTGPKVLKFLEQAGPYLFSKSHAIAQATLYYAAAYGILSRSK